MATLSPTLESTPVLRKRRRIGLALLVACLGLFGLDAVLFRTTLYTSILEPASAAGNFEMVLRREREAQSWLGDNVVVTLGNSRFGYSPKIIDHLPVKAAYVLRQAGIGGTNAMVWYYMLRDLDPTAQRYRAIVFGVDDYDDEDKAFQPDDDISALHYAIARLRWSDTIEFARSFHSRQVQWEAFRGAALKGIAYQSDIQAFLTHPSQRLANVELHRGGFAHWTYDYVESPRTMEGLQVDWSTMKATFPAGFTKDQRDTVSFLMSADPQNGRLAAYRRKWFGKIIDRYRGSRTKIIFIRLARGPILRPDNLVKKLSSSIREFASRPNVILADEHTFDSLEHPEFYKDAIHLNREGVARFSQMLSDLVTRILADQRTAR